MSRVHGCLLAVIWSLGCGTAGAGVLANTDPVPEGLEAELKIEHPTGSTEVRCYLTEAEDKKPCAAAVTSTLTLIFVGFWQDRKTTVRVTAPDGEVHEAQAINGALFKQLMIPGKSLGLYSVTATQRGGSRQGSFLLKRADRPLISVLKANVDAGDTVQYMLSGFAPNEQIALYVYRANGITSYSGVGSSYFDYVTKLAPAVADALGNAIVTIPTNANDPGGGYMLVTDPDSSRDDAASNQFWLSGGQRAPTPRRYSEVALEVSVPERGQAPEGNDPRSVDDGPLVPSARLRLAEPRDTRPSVREIDDTAMVAGATVEQLKLTLTFALTSLANGKLPESKELGVPMRDGTSQTLISAQPEAHGVRTLARAGADGSSVVTEIEPNREKQVVVPDAIAPEQTSVADSAEMRAIDNHTCGTAAVVGVAALSIRSEPSLTARKLGEAQEGVSVETLCDERTMSGGRAWIRVRDSDGVSGWMSEKYLLKHNDG